MVIFSDSCFIREFEFDIKLTIFSTSISTLANRGSYLWFRLGSNECN